MRNRSVPGFLGTKRIGNAHSVLVNLIISITKIYRPHVFQILVPGTRIVMALNKSLVYPTKLIQFDVSLLQFDLSVHPKYVEIMTALINIWPNMRCSRRTPVPLWANCFLSCRSASRVVYACPSDLTSFLVVCNVGDVNIERDAREHIHDSPRSYRQLLFDDDGVPLHERLFY